ncbi:Acid sphingomyelinase-like phosphodiesterase 3b precursor [Desulfovibrio sp. TomC]|nr:Acid sphingomyelinase-like phosphodiesterase 3b precursor [Desulfovibrio sp. TomC]
MRLLGTVLALCLAVLAVSAQGQAHAAKASGTGCPDGPATSYTASSAGAAGTFALFSDVHFTPFAAPALVPALVTAPVAEWREILSKAPAGLSPYGQDTNDALLQSFLDDMAEQVPHPDFILFPGDLLCHQFWELYPKLTGDHTQAGLEAFIQKTVEYFFGEVARRYPGVPIYAALGNNDSVEGDYRIRPESPYLALTAQAMALLLPNEASRADFLGTYPQYGCYAVTLPEAGGLRLIVLNNIFWSVKYPDASLGAPVAAFLERELSGARARGEKVWVMAHIPPGDDALSDVRKAADQGAPRYKPFLVESQNDAYVRLLTDYATSIRASFAGHVHRDDVRLFTTPDGKPAGGMRLAPSISPITGNNPGYQAYTYDRDTLAVLDVTTYSLDLAAGKGWRQEYEYAETYGRGLRDPGDWQATYRDLGTCPARRAAYARFFDLGSKHVDDVTEADFPDFWRAMAAPTRTVWETWKAPGAIVR